jgi:hypothetical protein
VRWFPSIENAFSHDEKGGGGLIRAGKDEERGECSWKSVVLKALWGEGVIDSRLRFFQSSFSLKASVTLRNGSFLAR